MISATSSIAASTAANAASNFESSTNATGGEDRFLKLLVAQLSNQDPMNPLDNAQVTSQMAQISTVSGIEKVNQSIKSLTDQMASAQMLQGSALVGREVWISGNTLAIHDGKAMGAVDLDLPASKVSVDVLSAGGQIIDTIHLGALGAGRHNFEWDASAYNAVDAPRFRVNASNGDEKVSYQSLARDRVQAVSTENGALSMQLQRLGATPYASVKSIL